LPLPRYVTTHTPNPLLLSCASLLKFTEPSLHYTSHFPIMPQFWIYHTPSPHKRPKRPPLSPPPLTTTTQNSTRSAFLTLPPELLALLPHYLPYQSTLRLLATCRYLRSLLSSSELAALRLKDGDEMYQMELSTYAALTRRDDWRPRSRWHEPRFGVEEIPCFGCLKWLVRFPRDSLYHSLIY
jgi:hypothetical protein